MYNITGTLKTKGEAQQVSEKFRKRDFVVTDNSSQYPQHILFQLVQDKCSLIDSVPEGQEVKVFFNIRGREWTSPQGEVKVFNTLDAWKIEYQGQVMQAPAPSATAAQPAAAPAASPGNGFGANTADDDLPF